MLGLEYTGQQLRDNLGTGFAAGLMDFLLNFPPGVVAGVLLGWGPLASVLLGGVTYISSSGIVARVLAELGRFNNPETPSLLSVLVLEDLAMAVFLPLVAVLLVGQGVVAGAVSVLIALATVAVVLVVAIAASSARLHERRDVFPSLLSDVLAPPDAAPRRRSWFPRAGWPTSADSPTPTGPSR
jgi:CPA2 family monovalent cation:H+ antiporter-2